MLLGMATCQLLAEDAVKQPDNRTVDYTIIVTGHELLTGVYPDGHTHFLTRTLRPLGLRCVGSMSVDDQSADIKQALQFACGRSQLVIVTGGLGPTDSDITRDVLSEFTGIPLQEHPEVLQAMEQRFNTPRDKLRANLRRQTRVPTRGTYLKNSSGSAVGLVFETDTALIVALPGPPRELQPMVRDELVPELARRFGTRTVGCSVTIRFIGIGQSQIDQTMKEHMHLLDDVLETSQFEAGRVDFTFALPNDRPEDRARLEELRKEFHQHLGDFIYADDATTTLEDCVLRSCSPAGRRSRWRKLAAEEVWPPHCVTRSWRPRCWGEPSWPPARSSCGSSWVSRTMPGTPRRTAGKLELLATTAAQRAHSQWSLVVGAAARRIRRRIRRK